MLANDDVKANKTLRISRKIDRFRTRHFVWILMQLISQNVEFTVERSWKEIACSMENFFCALENLESLFHKWYNISKFLFLFILLLLLHIKIVLNSQHFMFYYSDIMSCFKAEAFIRRRCWRIAVVQCSFCALAKALKNACERFCFSSLFISSSSL